MKTAEELFSKYECSIPVVSQGGAINNLIIYADFADALKEHDKEIELMIDDIIVKYEELNKLFPDEKNEEITTVVKCALGELKNKL